MNHIDVRYRFHRDARRSPGRDDARGAPGPGGTARASGVQGVLLDGAPAKYAVERRSARPAW